jgi:hypothetical protein
VLDRLYGLLDGRDLERLRAVEAGFDLALTGHGAGVDGVLESGADGVVEGADGRERLATGERRRPGLRQLDLHEGVPDDLRREADEGDGQVRTHPAGQRARVDGDGVGGGEHRRATYGGQQVARRAHMAHLLQHDVPDHRPDWMARILDRPHRAEVGRDRRQLKLDGRLQRGLEPSDVVLRGRHPHLVHDRILLRAVRCRNHGVTSRFGVIAGRLEVENGPPTVTRLYAQLRMAPFAYR